MNIELDDKKYYIIDPCGNIVENNSKAIKFNNIISAYNYLYMIYPKCNINRILKIGYKIELFDVDRIKRQIDILNDF